MAGLLRIPASGGKPERLTRPDGGSKGYAHAFPQYLPGGRGIVFTVWGGVDSEAPGMAFLPSNSSTWSTVTGSGWRGAYVASGHLLLGGPRNITAIPFEPGKPWSKAPPTLVIEDVFGSLNQVNSWFATSPTGTLVYVPGDAILGQLAWVDRGGSVTKIESEPGRLADPLLSPDGSKVLYVQDTTLWIMELRRGTRMRLTFDTDGENRFAAWSHDGATVYFASNRSGEWKIYSVPAAGGPARLVLDRPGVQFPMSSSPDGTLLFAERPAGNSTDLFMLSPKGEVTPFAVSPFSKVAGQFSPDGRLVAYGSDDTGRDEIYLRSVAHPDEVVTVSTDGGRSPKWSPDGRDLFYRRGDAFLAATVASNGKLAVGDSRKLFEVRAASGTSTQQAAYSVSPDGRRFLVQLPDPRAIPTQINVVLNWLEELKAKVPAR
jgi:serine/threonine-protein kinase